MITLAKVEIYGRFKGDVDGFSRSGVDPNVSGITDDDWRQIARLCQALSIARSGQASDAFAMETEGALRAATDNEATRNALREIRE